MPPDPAYRHHRRRDALSGALPQFRADQRGSTVRDNRNFVEGALRIVRTGSPWRDVPEVFGDENSAFRRFGRWSEKGVRLRIAEVMAGAPPRGRSCGLIQRGDMAAERQALGAAVSPTSFLQ